MSTLVHKLNVKKVISYEPYVYKWECECYSLVIECERLEAPEDGPLRSKQVVLYILITNCCVDGKICICQLCLIQRHVKHDFLLLMKLEEYHTETHGFTACNLLSCALVHRCCHNEIIE
jgi:hypothetical protein